MNEYVFPILCLIAGAYFLFRNIAHLRSEEKLRSYLESSSKAQIWLNKFGIEKTVALSKKVFLPLGCIVSSGLIGVGVWSISIMIMNR